MGLQADYEKAKAEAWQEFYNKELKDRPQWEPISDKEVFDYAFEAAYRYGVWCGMEKAQHSQSDGNPDHIPGATKKVDRTMIAAMTMHGMLSYDANAPLKDTAKLAVEFADALIAELGEEKV